MPAYFWPALIEEHCIIQVLLHEMYLFLYWHQQMLINSVEPHIVVPLVDYLNLLVSKVVVHVQFQFLQGLLLENQFCLMCFPIIDLFIFCALCAFYLLFVDCFGVLLLLGEYKVARFASAP